MTAKIFSLRSMPNGDNGVLYEQVTDVNVFPYQGLCFCCCRCCCCCSPPGLYSHSDELIVIEARCQLGFERRVDAAIYRTASRTKTPTQSSERGVDATGKLYA